MLYDSTKTLLRNILKSLETPGKVTWDDQIEYGKECLFEMHQMSRGLQRAYKTDSQRPKLQVSDTEKVNRAMPHVKSMTSAMRGKDQVKAIQSGKAALAEM
jgi:hypothetical protein